MLPAAGVTGDDVAAALTGVEWDMTDIDSLESVLGDDATDFDTDTGEALEQGEEQDGGGGTAGDEHKSEATPAKEAQLTDKSKPGTKPDDDADGMVPKRAVIDERRKRQELERELAALRAQLNDAVPKQPARPDVFEDQEGAFNYVESVIEQRTLLNRIEMSRELMMDQHQDYEDAEEQFVELAKADPSLVQKMRAAPLPAKFVYQYVKRHQQMQEMQDIEAYKAKLEAEIRAKVMAELEAQRSEGEEAELNATKRTSHPPQLISRRSAANQPAVHETLEDIFGGL